VREDRPYTEVLTARDIEVNGPLSHYLRFQTQDAQNFIYATKDHDFAVPELAFTDETWVGAMREATHAGVLTMPGYLLKFQSNRGRANRFRIDFECQSFVPPSTLETPAAGCQEDGTNLTARCTCRYCHQQLEPLAAHWGQFSEAGTTFLEVQNGTGAASVGNFFKKASNCVGSSSAFCNRFYVTASDADNPGALLAYQYADAAHPDITAALAGGPRKHAQEIVSAPRFHHQFSPDVIEYEPGEWCIESKSLKLYLWGFRDRAVFAEALAAEIAAEIMTTARPASVRVTLTQRPRGGIEVQVVAERLSG
jgi:hypothetical protein